MHAVPGPETIEFLQGGCALIVGTVGPDGAPHATRGWGLTVVDGEERTFRLLLDPGDETGVAHLTDGGVVAVTAADVPTLRSVQLKGRAVDIEPPTATDLAKASAYTDAFFDDIVETDGTPRPVLERIRPSAVVACTVVLDELFDQTPGPGAGAPLPRSS